MKKIIFILIVLLLFTSCSSKQADNTNDNYRTFYEIFVGSFSDSNNDGIGDLKGIIKRMDYLNDGNVNSKNSLGIQGIWLTPIFKSPSYHKYDVVDYYEIDPEFGTMDDLKELINEAHKRNIIVILDMVINHTSSQNEWFKEFSRAHQNNDYNNKYYDYYTHATRFEGEPNKAWCDLNNTYEIYECNFSYDMPELNFDNPDVRQEVLNIAKYYLNLGIDGFRFDAGKYVYLNDNNKSIDFWTWYTNELKKIKEDVYLVAEIWSSDSEIDKYIKAMNCFDFHVSNAEGLISSSVRNENINTFTKYVVSYQEKVKGINNDAMPVFFISNHDMDRSAGYLNVTKGLAYIGANLYLLAPGSPFIYYGEEIGIKGTRGSANTDANRRLKMLWGDGDTVEDPEGSTFVMAKQANGTLQDQLKDKNSLFYHYQKLIRLRKQYPAIARGTYSIIELDGNINGLKVDYNDETIYIVHNINDTKITINNSTFTKMLDYVGFGEAKFNNSTLEIDGYTSVILK